MSNRLDPAYIVETDSGSIGVHDLTVGEAAPDAPVVLLVHGITANGLCWRPVARMIDARHGSGRVRVLAPDLRGRGSSRAAGLTGSTPPGLSRHVDDLLRVMTAFAAQRPVVVGHSMGGFVTALLAATAPERVAAAVLVDGGIGLPPPPGTDPARWSPAEIDAVLAAVLGPALSRLSLSWSDAEDHLALWADHPAVGPLLAGPAGQSVRDWLTHDLVPAGGGRWRSSCVEDVIRADGRDILLDAQVRGAARVAADAGVPISFVWAGRGLLDQTPGLYPEGEVEALTDGITDDVIAVPAANHYDVLLLDPGLSLVAAAVERALADTVGTR